ncbi:hypothetical protein D3C80_1348480 [compost metagenome]
MGSPAADPKPIIIATSKSVNCLTPLLPDRRSIVKISKNMIVERRPISTRNDVSMSLAKIFSKLIIIQKQAIDYLKFHLPFKSFILLSNNNRQVFKQKKLGWKGA